MRNHPLWRLVRQVGNVIAATCAAMAVLFACAAGFGGVPALGRALDPGHGAWTSAAGGKLPVSRTLRLPGIAGGATVSFGSHGIAAINAASEGDAMVALGYTHASFRLAEMDLARRLAEGSLAQLAGTSAVPSDEFELRLGLLRTARREWAEMPKNGIEAHLLESYSIGVNDYLSQLRKTRQWPAIFSLAGVYPADWTPVDSLAVQGDMTQELDYTTTPLDYTLLARSLGMTRTMQWFPVLPANKQNPYDPGPYQPRQVAPLATAMTATAAGHPARAIRGAAVAAGLPSVPSAGVAQAAAAMLAQTRALPAGQVHGYPDSNAWAANGPKVSGGGSMLAGDPHLPQTLPSVWFEVAISAPGYYVSGVSLPGLPGVLIGHNRHIAWSLTDTQNQATLFYAERTSRTHPGQYFWRDKWRAMRHVAYTIYVRGGVARQLTVDETVHGPVMTRAGQTLSVDWMGNLPSPDVAVLQQISVAHNFSQFRAALVGWRAPAQNFVYADNRGNIGAISAGYYPVVRHGTPWLPMPGTGADDVAGVIPYAAVPQSYDPPGHVIATANQRPVTAAYPYYIGTTANFFDPGYRASREYAFLDRRSNLTMPGFAALQKSLVDGLAVRLLPSIDKMLRGSVAQTAMDKHALALLRGWNDSMDANSAAASIWWALWTDYLYTTFEPWWRSARVPVTADRAGLTPSTGQASLDEVLERWTLTDQANPVFSPPGNPSGTAASVLRAAFATAVAQLHSKLGGSPSSWAWGKLHSRRFPSLLRAPGLGYGPQAAGGDPWSVDAADGLPVSEAGPSWRMIVQPGTAGHAPPTGWGIYPGGQSENPASPWYQNLVADWWNGRYLPMPSAGPAVVRGNVLWELEP